MECTTDHDRNNNNNSEDGHTTETTIDGTLHCRPTTRTAATTGNNSPAQSMFSETSVTATAVSATAIGASATGASATTVADKPVSMIGMIMIQNPSAVAGQRGGVSPLAVSPFTNSSSLSTSSTSQCTTSDSNTTDDGEHQSLNSNNYHQLHRQTHVNNNSDNNNNSSSNNNNQYKPSEEPNNVTSTKHQNIACHGQDTITTNGMNGLTVIVEESNIDGVEDDDEMVTYWKN